MRLIDTGSKNAAMNMAIDEVLLQSKEPVLRFYQWKPPALSMGYFQDIKDINLRECKKRNIDVVRRITGGKTVLHDKELTYSFIIDENKMPASIISSYKKISRAILYALKQLGIDAMMKKDIEKNSRKTAICFNEPSYYEIVVDGKKVVGSAQTRKQGKLLQHGSILMDMDYEKLVSVFNVDDKKKTIENTKKRVTSISQLIKRPSMKELKKQLGLGFEDNFEAELEEDKLTKEEKKMARELAKEKYSKKVWNIR